MLHGRRAWLSQHFHLRGNGQSPQPHANCFHPASFLIHLISSFLIPFPFSTPSLPPSLPFPSLCKLGKSLKTPCLAVCPSAPKPALCVLAPFAVHVPWPSNALRKKSMPKTMEEAMESKAKTTKLMSMSRQASNLKKAHMMSNVRIRLTIRFI